MKTEYAIDISYNFNICKYLRKTTVKSVIRKILKAHGVIHADISVAIVDKSQIIEVNKQYLESETETDVIAFDFNTPEIIEPSQNTIKQKHATDNEDKTVADIPNHADDPEIRSNHKILKENIDGEIIINGELAVRIASEFNHSPAQELLLYIIHGLLHIIGYDDIKPSDKKIMWAFQQHYSKLFTDKQ